jgi:pilus assembly protein FimV
MIRPAKTIKRIGGGLLLLAATISGQAYAAGLGKLTVTSALGEPLSAEIELVSLQPGEFESLSARVASPDAYRDARIEYVGALRGLKFTTERRPNGQPILKVSTFAPVNEPFLDVLVELNWPAGRYQREYPILLDPPGFNQVRPPAAARPPAASAPTTASVSPTPPSSSTSASGTTASPVTPSAPVEPSKPSVASSAPAKAAPSGSPSDTYGPVKKGDTLNKIATEMKSDSVSLEQMLVALYRENQEAFIDKNMNRLKTGQILRVPTASDVSKITETEARKEVRVQVSNWKQYRDSVASSVAAGPASTSASTNQASGKIATAKPDAPAKGAESKDVLKLSKTTEAAPGKAGTAASKGGPSPTDQINALREDAIAREKALKEAQSRVADLEKQLQDMRKLMELKGISPPGAKGAVTPPGPAVVAKADDKTKPVDPKAAVKPVEPPKPAEPAKVDPKVAQVTPPAAKPGDVKPAEPPKPVEPAKPAESKPADPAKPTDPVKVAEAPKPAEPPKPAETKPAEPKPAPKPAVKTAPPPPPPPSMMDTVMEQLPIIAGGVGALGILGFVGWTMAKRRKNKNTAGPFTSAASSILPSDLKPPTTTSGKAAGGLIDTGNSSFLTDFDKAGPGTIDTDEVDPVAEAEVYIAYGRDAQAEEILKEAMARDKSRHEITLKLLEIYHTRKSNSAFENLAREFKDNVGVTSPLWARAAGMGAQLDPANPLYAGFAQDFVSTAAMQATPAAAAAGGGGAGGANPPDLDFDLGFTSEAPKVTMDVPLDTPSTAPDDIGFDLNLGPASTASAPAPAPAASLDAGLDFDLGLDKTVAAPAKAAAPAPAAGGGSFDFDLSSLSLDSPSEEKTKTMPAASAAPASDGGFNLGDISLDLDSPLAQANATAGPPSTGDSAGTKLELARAYVEIGDKDGAKEILQEVVREGTAQQKAEAQSLLAGL